MNYNKIFLKSFLAMSMIVIFASCAKKLDLFPQNDYTSDKVYNSYSGYQSVLAKIYGAMSIGGNQGGAGQPDISGGLDEGSQIAFIRPFFNCQELTTDEAVCYWNDQTIKNYHNLKYNSDDPFIKGVYARPMWNITLINEYLRQSTDANLAAVGITGTQAADIKASRAEVRFLRAFNYWVMMDLFGNSTFITENDLPGSGSPAQIKRANLYDYISNELKAIENDLPAPHTQVYGRVDKGAAWALMARLQLNANVYLAANDKAHYDTAITYALKAINGGYTLDSSYKRLFMADNDKRTNEIIWAIECDGLITQGYGNTTFLVNAASGDDKPTDYFAGSGGAGWKGYMATKSLSSKFADPSGATDSRAMFSTSKYSPAANGVEIASDLLTVNESIFGNNNTGVHVNKFRNIRSDGAPIHDQTSFTFADVDFPIFRLSEMYLIYAEATLRGGNGGTTATAVNYINLLRERAYGNTNGDINITNLDLNFVLDERERELYWEGHRRTDLVRYGYLTSSSYLWPWKAGVNTGAGVDSKFNLFPIPSSVRNSNPNLDQNTGF